MNKTIEDFNLTKLSKLFVEFNVRIKPFTQVAVLAIACIIAFKNKPEYTYNAFLYSILIILGFTIGIFFMEVIRMIIFVIQNKLSFKELISLFKESIKEVYNGK